MIMTKRQMRKAIARKQRMDFLPATLRVSGSLHRRASVDGVTYKVADSREEREAAMRLVYDSYVKAGLIARNRYGMRVTPYHLLPLTDIFVALKDRQVAYTVTLITDDGDGVPLDSIFPNELNAVRHEGISFAEVSCLAGREGLDRRSGYEMFLNLIALTFQYSRHNDIDRLLLAVHPRHARFYERIFGCEVCGATKSYAAVCDHPAVPMVHDFRKLDDQPYKLFDRMYAHSYANCGLLRQPMSTADRMYFGEAVSSSEQHPAAL